MIKTTITIHGAYGGRIWMPATMCAKPLNAKLRASDSRKDDTLREAVLDILNDGDFQNCQLASDCFIRFTRQVPDAKGYCRRHTRMMDVTAFPSIADLIADAEASQEIYDCFADED